MDKILLNNMHFYGYHGVLEAEKVLGQKFFVDAELVLDLREAGVTDNVEDTVSYAGVYRQIEEIVTKERYNLLEALGHRICKRVLEEHEKISEVTVTIRKPGAPVNGHYDNFAIRIQRSRQDYD